MNNKNIIKNKEFSINEGLKYWKNIFDSYPNLHYFILEKLNELKNFLENLYNVRKINKKINLNK